MNEFRILPLMIYFWILAAFIINYSSEAKKIRKNHHNKKCMTYKNPSNNIESRQNAHKRKKRLINGWEGDIRQMPWMVSLSTTYQQNGQNRSGFATGSLISPRHVLTCGHCIRYDRLNENSTITVVYGSANKNEGNRIVLNKTAAHVHPNYTSFAISPNLYTTNDLAIVHLGQDIEFDETVHSICLVCLGKNNTSNPEGNVTIAGWGSTVDPCAKLPLIYPDVFRWDIVRTHPCLNPNSVTIDKVCHEANLQHTISGGDSGGPVLAIRNSKNDGRQYQIGVHGGNICNPSSQRENSFDKIDGEWVKKLTGVKCKNYNEE